MTFPNEEDSEEYRDYKREAQAILSARIDAGTWDPKYRLWYIEDDGRMGGYGLTAVIILGFVFHHPVQPQPDEWPHPPRFEVGVESDYFIPPREQWEQLREEGLEALKLVQPVMKTYPGLPSILGFLTPAQIELMRIRGCPTTEYSFYPKEKSDAHREANR